MMQLYLNMKMLRINDDNDVKREITIHVLRNHIAEGWGRGVLLLCLFAVSVLSWGQQPRVVAELDSIAILIGQQTHLTLKATAGEAARVDFPDFQPRTYLIPGVEIVDVSRVDTARMEGGQKRLSQRLTLTAFEDSLYGIPPIEVQVDGHPYSSKTIALKVVTMDVDTLHLDQFFPPKDVQSNPFLWSEWSGYFGLSVLMVVLSMLGIYLFVRLKENKPIISRVKIIKRVPPHQKALQEIDRLKAEKLSASEDQKVYYTRLTDTLRRYIEERFGFSAMEMTTTEIIDRLWQSGDQTMIAELRELFETADLVKFAKYSALINENDLNLVNAVHFIDQTKVEGLPTEERIVPTLNESDIRTMQNRRLLKFMLWCIGIGVLAIFCYVAYGLVMLL